MSLQGVRGLGVVTGALCIFYPSNEGNNVVINICGHCTPSGDC